MIERAIENWLINTNERNYQVPFCQVLISQGYEILYISPHGQLEFGKDIIAISPNGETVAYQLKSGNINLTEWGKIQREIYDLIDQKCKHPNVDKNKPHVSYIVANGVIEDNVFQRIDEINNTETHYSKLFTINKDQLLKLFLENKQTFLPQSFEGFSKFLEFFTLDGDDFLKKKNFFDFIKNNILISKSQKSNNLNSIFSSVILTNNLLNSFQQKSNYYAQLEAWTILYFTIIGFIKAGKISDKKIDNTLEIIQNEIIGNIKNLTDEFVKRDNLIEGMPFGDGDLIYKARVTIVLGVVCCNKVYFNTDFDENVHKKIVDNLKYLWYWGESSFPFLFFIIKYLEKNKLNSHSLPIINTILEATIKHNGFRNKEQAFPNPYYDVNTILESIFHNKKIDYKQFKSNSYILNPLIEMFARRELKEPLERNWRKISHIQISKFVSDQEYESFYFWNKKGVNYSNFPEQTQSWKILLEKSNSQSNPDLFVKNNLLPLFFMVYPHRISEELVKLLDSK